MGRRPRVIKSGWTLGQHLEGMGTQVVYPFSSREKHGKNRKTHLVNKCAKEAGAYGGFFFSDHGAVYSASGLLLMREESILAQELVELIKGALT